MSKPRYRWWGYVRWIIRDYPEHAQELYGKKYDLRSIAVSGMPGGKGGTSDPTSDKALIRLSPQAQREFDAVDKAVRQTSDPNIIKMIKLIYWDGTHTVVGAGFAVGYEEAQAKRIHGIFIRKVASNLGLL